MWDNDKSLNTLMWLDFEVDAHGDGVSLLKCKICCKFKERLQLMRNFCLVYIKDSSNVITSSFREHAESDMHKSVMQFHRSTMVLFEDKQKSPLLWLFHLSS